MRVVLTLCVLGAVLVVGNAATAGEAAERKELTDTLRKLQADLEALDSETDGDEPDQAPAGEPEQVPAADGQTHPIEGDSDDNDDVDGPNDIALKTIEGLFYFQGQMQGCIEKLLHPDKKSSMTIQSRKTGARPVDKVHLRTRSTFKDIVEPLRRHAAGATIDRLAHPMKDDQVDDGEQAYSPDEELGELIQAAQATVIALDVFGS